MHLTILRHLSTCIATLIQTRALIGIGKPAVEPLLNAVSEKGEQELVNTILKEISRKDSIVILPSKTSEKIDDHAHSDS